MPTKKPFSPTLPSSPITDGEVVPVTSLSVPITWQTEHLTTDGEDVMQTASLPVLPPWETALTHHGVPATLVQCATWADAEHAVPVAPGPHALVLADEPEAVYLTLDDPNIARLQPHQLAGPEGSISFSTVATLWTQWSVTIPVGWYLSITLTNHLQMNGALCALTLLGSGTYLLNPTVQLVAPLRIRQGRPVLRLRWQKGSLCYAE